MEIQVKAFLERLRDGMYGSIDTAKNDVNFTAEQLAEIKKDAYRIEMRFDDNTLYGVYNIEDGVCINYNKRMADSKEIGYLALLGISI